MVSLDETIAWRRQLPHLARRGVTYFVTFCSAQRHILAPADRTITLDACVRGHKTDFWLHCVCVMPDHVHLLFTPYEFTSMKNEISRLKSVSAHKINILRDRTGRVWQREYFDRIVRSDEDIRRKAEYICQNPVRAGLVASVDEYPWIWRSWIEGAGGAAEAAALH